MSVLMLPLRRAAAGAGAGRMVLCAGRALLLPTHPPPRRHLVLTPCLPHVLHFTSSTTPMKATSTSTLRRRRPLPQQPHAACFCSKPKDGEDDLSPPSTPPSTPASSSSSGSPQPPRIDIPGVHYATKRLAIVYTCKVCETRSTKAFSQQAYDHGVVLVRCPGCDNLHLIVDRLGWFEDGGTDVQKILAERGESVLAVTDDNVLSLTPKDILGGGGEGEREEGREIDVAVVEEGEKK